MRLQIGLKGKLFGIQPVNVTPFDLKIPDGYITSEVLTWLIGEVDGKPVRIGPFSGKAFARIKG